NLNYCRFAAALKTRRALGRMPYLPGLMCGFAVFAVPPGRRKHPRPELRRPRETRDRQDLLFPERLPCHQRGRERVELPAMRGEQPPRPLVALGNDPLDLGIDLPRRLFAVGPPPREHALGAQVLFLPRCELHETDPVAHP